MLKLLGVDFEKETGTFIRTEKFVYAYGGFPQGTVLRHVVRDSDRHYDVTNVILPTGYGFFVEGTPEEICNQWYKKR
jgi:hypothetical protein